MLREFLAGVTPSNPPPIAKPTRRVVGRRAVGFAAVVLIVVGAASAHGQLTTERSIWMAGSVADARLGEAVAVCDFNGDGADDLAIGAPDHDESPMLVNVGQVMVRLGSPAHDIPGAGGILTFDAGDLIADGLQAGARFGAALAVADFDLDGYCDLAIGMPGQTVDGQLNAGAVAVVYGAATILDLSAAYFIDQGPLIGIPESGDQFGAVLAAGRLGSEPQPDLAIGVPGEDAAGFSDVGAVHIVLSDGSAGLTIQGDRYVHQDIDGVFGFASPDDRFGSALAIGDVTGDGVPDLVVGSPGDLVGTTDQAGSVQVLPGAVDGVEISSDQVFWSQNSTDVLGALNTGDDFGAALALADFNGDGHLDLAIGVPGESQFGPEQSGAVAVLFGTALGLSAHQNQLFFESLVSPEVAAFDRFGESLTAADFDADGHADLAIGMPLDNVFGVVNAGNVAVLYGSRLGLMTSGAQLWNGFFLLTVEPGDALGFALATGHFSGPGGRDLLIGAPGRMFGSQVQAGGVFLVRSPSLFTDGFESGLTARWAVTVP